MANDGDERRIAVIIEDDADIRHLLETVLTQAGFDAIATSNGVDGVRAVRAYDPVVTTLDVSMPGMDGFETAKRIRAFSSTYIVMLTARDEEIDTLMGLDSGADDYLTKPFRPRELRARIDAMMRRPRQVVTGEGEADAAQAPSAPGSPATAMPNAAAPATATSSAGSAASGAASPAVPSPAAEQASESAPTPGRHAEPGEPEEGWLEHNGLRLNPEMRLVTLDDRELELTRTEFDLLAALLESKRRVRTKADLVLLLRGESYVTAYYVNEADKRAVEVHMGNLRKKLGDSISSPRWLETVRGVGYRLAAPDES
jgi:two-component system OmpR family response regulator